MTPVIEDDGFVLWESNAIVHLCAKHPRRRSGPADLAPGHRPTAGWNGRAPPLARQIGPPFIQLIRQPQSEGSGDEPAGIPPAGELWQIVDRQLGQNENGYRVTISQWAMPLSILACHVDGAATAGQRALSTLPTQACHPSQRWYEQLQATRELRHRSDRFLT